MKNLRKYWAILAMYFVSGVNATLTYFAYKSLFPDDPYIGLYLILIVAFDFIPVIDGYDVFVEFLTEAAFRWSNFIWILIVSTNIILIERWLGKIFYGEYPIPTVELLPATIASAFGTLRIVLFVLSLRNARKAYRGEL